MTHSQSHQLINKLHEAKSFFRTFQYSPLVKILYNFSVHYRVHNRALSIPVLSQINPITLKYILVLSSHLCLGFPSSPSLHVFKLKVCMHLLITLIRAACLANLYYIIWCHIRITNLYGKGYELWTSPSRSFNQRQQESGRKRLRRRAGSDGARVQWRDVTCLGNVVSKRRLRRYQQQEVGRFAN